MDEKATLAPTLAPPLARPVLHIGPTIDPQTPKWTHIPQNAVQRGRGGQRGKRGRKNEKNGKNDQNTYSYYQYPIFHRVFPLTIILMSITAHTRIGINNIITDGPLNNIMIIETSGAHIQYQRPTAMRGGMTIMTAPEQVGLF